MMLINKNIINFLIGVNQISQKIQLVESDILLLDISNENQYIWTNNFDPSPPVSNASDKLLINKQVMIGAIVGSLFGGLLLLFGGFFSYK